MFLERGYMYYFKVHTCKPTYRYTVHFKDKCWGDIYNADERSQYSKNVSLPTGPECGGQERGDGGSTGL